MRQYYNDRVIELLIIIVLSIVTLILPSKVFAQDEAEVNVYVHSVEISAVSKLVVFSSLIETFNTYGYFVDAMDTQAGTLSASIIDYSSFYRGKKFTGMNDLADMQQVMEVEVTEIQSGKYELSLRLRYRNEIVTVLEPYQTFILQLEQSNGLD